MPGSAFGEGTGHLSDLEQSQFIPWGWGWSLALCKDRAKHECGYSNKNGDSVNKVEKRLLAFGVGSQHLPHHAKECGLYPIRMGNHSKILKQEVA